MLAASERIPVGSVKKMESSQLCSNIKPCHQLFRTKEILILETIPIVEVDPGSSARLDGESLLTYPLTSSLRPLTPNAADHMLFVRDAESITVTPF